MKPKSYTCEPNYCQYCKYFRWVYINLYGKDTAVCLFGEKDFQEFKGGDDADTFDKALSEYVLYLEQRQVQIKGVCAEYCDIFGGKSK